MQRFSIIAAVLLSVVACKGGDKDAIDEDTAGDTDVTVDSCGDGELNDDEQCDNGALNGPDANCYADCTANPNQVIIASGAVVIDEARLDAAGVTDDAAPAGVGAWVPAGEGVQAKFNLMIPMFDFGGLLDPNQLAAAPWRPPVGWLGDIALSQVEEISFWTNTPEGESGSPYYLVLYTQPDTVDDHDTWYGYRLTGRKSDLGNDTGEAGNWVKWSITDTDRQFVFVDQPVTGTFSGTGLPTVAQLIEQPAFDWSAVNQAWPQTSIDYGAELMRYVSIQTSSGTATTGSQAMIDLVEIRFTDGRSVTIDLEP